MTDHYELLQVRENAEPEVIQAAFRALARKYHPDFGGDAERMVALNEAWEILGDRARRAAYDRERQALKGAAPSVIITTTPTAYERPTTATPVTPRFANDSGTVLDFGRYIGWSIGRLAQEDPDYLEWLARSSVGRRYAPEIYKTLARRAPVVSTATPAARKRWGRR